MKQQKHTAMARPSSPPGLVRSPLPTEQALSGACSHVPLPAPCWGPGCTHSGAPDCAPRSLELRILCALPCALFLLQVSHTHQGLRPAQLLNHLETNSETVLWPQWSHSASYLIAKGSILTPIWHFPLA